MWGISKVVTTAKPRIIKLAKSAGFKKYFFNTGWLFVNQIVRMVVALLVGVYVARYLGPERYGLLSYAVSFAGLFGALATLGLDGIVIRELVKDENQRDQLLGTAFWLKIAGGTLSILVIMTTIQFTDSNEFTKLIVGIIAIGVLLDSFNVINFYFQAKVQSKFTAIASVAAVTVSSGLKLWLIFSQADLLWFAAAFVIEKFVLISGYIFFYIKNWLNPFQWQFRGQMAVSLLKDSWPLILSSIAIAIYMRIDQVMLKEMVNVEAVGVYAVAVRISEIWYFIPTIIVASLFPAIINAQKTNKTEYYKRLQKLYTLLLWLAVVFSIVISWSSDLIITIIYGSKYLAASTVLSVYVWGGLAVFTGSVWSKWILAENKQGLGLVAQVSAVLLNIPLNLYLIPIYGEVGAAWATVISYTLGSIFAYSLYKPNITYSLILKALFPFMQIRNP